MKEEVTMVFIDGKDSMTMSDVDEFKGHTGSTFHGIFISTRRTKAAVAAKRDKLKITTMGAGIHGTTKGRITTA